MEQKTSNHLRAGLAGEDAVAKYLVGSGFSLVERNYWKPYGEIDIVAKKNGILHFVEVKAVSGDVPRQTSGEFRPEDHMNYGKRQRQKRVIEAYLLERKIKDETDWQVDLVCVYLDPQLTLVRLDVYEDVVLA